MQTHICTPVKCTHTHTYTSEMHMHPMHTPTRRTPAHMHTSVKRTCTHLWENTKNGLVRGTLMVQVNKDRSWARQRQRRVKGTWEVKERKLNSELGFFDSCYY